MYRTPKNLTALSLSLVTLFSLLGAGLWAAPAQAQECDTDWREPIVCRVELVASVRGERPSPVRDVVNVPAGVDTILSVRPEDQFDRGFPAQRFAYDIVPGNNCNGLFAIDEERQGEIRITPGSRTGSCERLIQVANNMNVDRRVTLRSVGSAAAPAPAPTTGGPVLVSGDEAEVLASWLYRGLLGREAEPAGLASTADAIRRGGVERQVDQILASPEFSQSRQGLSAIQLLERLLVLRHLRFQLPPRLVVQVGAHHVLARPGEALRLLADHHALGVRRADEDVERRHHQEEPHRRHPPHPAAGDELGGHHPGADEERPGGAQRPGVEGGHSVVRLLRELHHTGADRHRPLTAPAAVRLAGDLGVAVQTALDRPPRRAARLGRHAPIIRRRAARAREESPRGEKLRPTDRFSDGSCGDRASASIRRW